VGLVKPLVKDMRSVGKLAWRNSSMGRKPSLPSPEMLISFASQNDCTCASVAPRNTHPPTQLVRGVEQAGRHLRLRETTA
jgi:hypothetical protein